MLLTSLHAVHLPHTNAFLQVTRHSVEPTSLFLSIARTVPAMRDSGVLVVCFATNEAIASKGNSADDYATLGQTFSQVTP